MIRVLIFSFFIVCCMSFTDSFGQNTKSTPSPEEFIDVTIDELLSNRNEYNGTRVRLDGFVDKVEYTESNKGEPFTLFRLNDGKDDEVRVYYEDEHLALSKGDKVQIQGRYKKQKKYFLYKIKNVIKARTVKKIEN